MLCAWSRYHSFVDSPSTVSQIVDVVVSYRINMCKVSQIYRNVFLQLTQYHRSHLKQKKRVLVNLAKLDYGAV